MKFGLSFLFVSLFLFSSCSLPGTQTETQIAEGAHVFEGSGFSLSVPDNWVEPKATDIPLIRQGTVLLALLSPEVKYGFSHNILVIGDTLTQPVTSKKYSELNNFQTTKNYLEYTKLSDEALLFGDTDESRVYVFEARYNTTTPRMKFIQTAKVCGTKVYLLHAAISLDKEPDNYIDLFRSFQCR